MARTSEDISRAIRAKLKVIDPDISTEPLTPERKIIDTVSDVIAESQVDTFVLNYNMDIDSKFGADLDRFVALWGFARQGGRRATGTATFSRALAADRDIVIPIGTTIMKPASSISPVVLFQTTASVVLYVGTTSVEAPIEATLIGSIGNVAAGTIIGLGSGSVGDISTITNQNATTGGTDIESDAELRIRFKNTIFRNISGTQDQYLALSISSRFTKKANVIGPVSRFVEYLQVDNDVPTAAEFGSISEIPYSKYTYDFDYYVTDGDLANEVFYTPRGVHYTFNDTVPPSFTVEDLTVLPINTVVLMEHTYCSINSRNDPATGKANYVDVYVSGQDVVGAIESCIFPTVLNNLVVSPGTSFDTGN